MRCAECGVQTAEATPYCVVCGAPAVERPSLVAGGPGVSPTGAPSGSPGFSITRLRPGYDLEQVDAFLGAVRDTFAGVRRPLLTAEEIRAEQFAVTRLRPGYDMEEVDVFLADAEARLVIRCVECGAQTAGGTQCCTTCGAPVTGQLAVADASAGRPDDHLETAPGPAKDASPVPAAVRWFFLTCLILFLILFTIGQLGVVHTSQSTDLHGTMVGVSWLSIFGVLLFLVLFECARKQFAGAQLGWAVVPLLSLGLLASVPFLWLALVRRRVRDWVVFTVYLAATIAVIVALSSVPSTTSITGLPAVIWPLLLVIAPVHAVLAFSPAAKVPAWREAYPGRPLGTRQQSFDDALPPEDRRPDADQGHPKPTLTDLKARGSHGD